MKEVNYSYPIDPSWSTQELETVIRMFNLVEDAYEGGVSRERLLKGYRDFKMVVPAKSEEKQLGREFFKKSGYLLYDVVKTARGTEQKVIKLVQE